MRIREIIFHDFRSFRGLHRISFVDPLTDAVRPISVLAGTNGAGKTTILETIEALLALLSDSAKPRDLVMEARRSGFVALTVEFDPLEIGSGGNGVFAQESPVLHLAAGREDLMPPWFSAAPDSFGLLSGTGKNQIIWQPHNSTLRQRLGVSVSAMLHDQHEIARRAALLSP